MILKVSRPALDLSEKDEEFIVVNDNADWDKKKWRRLCLGPILCLARCGGDPKQARKQMVTCALLSVGRCGETPLNYRWKGTERFACKLYRGQRQHGTWLHTYSRIWPRRANFWCELAPFQPTLCRPISLQQCFL